MYMRAFAEAWPTEAIVQQAVGQLPWGHNLVLLTKLKAPEQRLAYAQQAIAQGWSRNMLTIHIERKLLEREGKAQTNFDLRLAPQASDLARESLKDPYVFDFLGIGQEAGAFKPEHAGKLSFYLSAVDAQMKHASDNPTIGLLLCKSKNKVVAEYALRDSSKPIGVAEYQLLESLPAEFQTSLPTIESLEQALQQTGSNDATPSD
jgi:predicted nuclease of restriction endonuclease-like (RecB) superfamily